MIQPLRVHAKDRAVVTKIAPPVPGGSTEDKIVKPDAVRYFCDGRFQVLDKLGEGSYGKVYKVMDTVRGHLIALKKVKFHGERHQGIPQSSLRELAILKEANHENIIKLYDIIQGTANSFELFLAFEMSDMDLRKYIHVNAYTLSRQRVKSIMHELVRGIDYLHSNRIIHRDLKPENLLLSKAGDQLKIADFGLSRTIHNPLRPYSREILSLWYRSPELCMGYKHYSVGVDNWAIGCIFYELISGQPLFKAKSDTDMLFKIFDLFGTPTPATWSWIAKITGFNGSFPIFKPKGLKSLLPNIEADALDLMTKFLELNPITRLTCAEALNHPYFS